MTFCSYLLLLICFYITVVINNIFHELGHALIFLIYTKDNCQIVFDRYSKKREFKHYPSMKFGRVYVYFKLSLVLLFAFTAESPATLSLSPSKFRTYASMGPFFNIIAGILLYFTFTNSNIFPNYLIYVSVSITSALLLANIIPTVNGKDPSDGYCLLRPIEAQKIFSKSNTLFH